MANEKLKWCWKLATRKRSFRRVKYAGCCNWTAHKCLKCAHYRFHLARPLTLFARDLHSIWLLSPSVRSFVRSLPDYSYDLANYTGPVQSFCLLICSLQLFARWHQIKSASPCLTSRRRRQSVCTGRTQRGPSIGQANLHNAITTCIATHYAPLSHKSLIKSP